MIKKNTTLELLKLIASYMVVFIHVSFLGNTGIVMDALARFAVPLFFVTSGFFSYQITPEKIKERIKHILKLIIMATLCYIIFDISELILSGNIGGILPYLLEILHPVMILRLIVFNKPVSSGHLWYLWAMLYVYFVFYFITKRKFEENKIFKLSVFLLALHILLGEGLSLFGITIPIMVIRNFAFMGFPLFAFGLFIKKHRDRICRVHDIVLVPATLIGVAASLGSRFLFGKNELYAGTLLVLFAAVVAFLKHPNPKAFAFMNRLDGCSTYIYIFHIMVSSVLSRIYEAFNIGYVASTNLHPLWVCVATTILAFIIVQAKSMIKKNNTPNNNQTVLK